MNISKDIFRAYDIRGRYGVDLTEEVATRLADAFVSYTGATSIVVGHDMRTSGGPLMDALTKRLVALGITVEHIGMVSTDVFYFACGSLGLPGIMVTASHNPPEYNGFKLIRQLPFAIGNGQGMEEIRDMVVRGYAAALPERPGSIEQIDIWPSYISTMCSFVDVTALKKFHVVVDAGNGMAGVIWRRLQERLPITITELFFEPDGTFPNHAPDPLQADNRKMIEAKVKEVGADVGFAYDADVDRLFVIDNTGTTLEAEFTLALLAEYQLSMHPRSTVIYDVRSSWVVRDEVTRLGGKTIMERVGHAYIKRTMQEQHAVLGGEKSGHFYIKDFFFSDSGIAASILMLAVMQSRGESLATLVDGWRKKYFMTDELNFTVEDRDALFKELREKYNDAKVSDIDGVSFEYQDWHFSVRASNTEPVVRLNVEAIGSKELLDAKKEEVLGVIKKYST